MKFRLETSVVGNSTVFSSGLLFIFCYFLVTLGVSACKADNVSPSGNQDKPGVEQKSVVVTQETSQNDAGSQEMSEKSFKVKFETSKGDFLVEVHPDWAPLGAARFKELVEMGFYDEVRFFRVLPGFVAQFGISGDPKLAEKWRNERISDDPVKHGNKRGTITFATSGANSRTTQVFINFKDNDNLDGMGFAAFGEIVEGMESVVDKLYAEYGEGAPRGQGPNQAKMQSEGNTYLQKEFPKLDYVKKARLVP
jgi:peptidyl-prolyl cis-trans isomerase A (cyclophilin A)